MIFIYHILRLGCRKILFSAANSVDMLKNDGPSSVNSPHATEEVQVDSVGGESGGPPPGRCEQLYYGDSYLSSYLEISCSQATLHCHTGTRDNQL